MKNISDVNNFVENLFGISEMEANALLFRIIGQYQLMVRSDNDAESKVGLEFFKKLECSLLDIRNKK